MKTFRVKAILTFKDGQMGGQIKVKAADAKQAEMAARARLANTWGIETGIQIVSVKS